ncbi:serine--tRNA ligase [Taibaiella chishuiensis]|uniref:Serine--tRNA ligase n=1 Tax=Taibaiella chishuiensis TaxID=1434707 RepID=A0A2P8CYU5_9BACT|nr:serine--tRNA ligase [Taibaiella chishuiensis]PSK90139.1 seryl-tRNA synthetase [Taibaiella chishuiensis]
MLQINLFRTDKEQIIAGLQKKHFKDLHVVDEIIALDEEKRNIQQQSETLAAAMNAASKSIGQLIASGDKAAAEAKKQEVTQHREQAKELGLNLAAAEQKLHDLVISLPNLPHASVPEGKTPEENEVVRSGGAIPQLHEGAVPHWDLTTKYKLIDFELGNKITGSGFPVYTNKGARLQRGLIQYFLDYNTGAGYTEYQVPHMVNEESAYGTGQLPDKEGQMYHAKDDNFFLIPTSEVPLTNLYRDEIVKEEQLPVRMTAYTPCFRREAGSYGKDVRGLNRLHQFDKVELVQICHPTRSYEVLEEMVLHVEKLLQSLELPYRILRLCGGDMSFTAALTYDFEVYSTAQQRWLEVSSVSNFETFQTNRMKIRFKDEQGKTQLLHSLNGSSLALPRIMACLLENNQYEGGIRIPAVLEKYVGGLSIG